MAKTTRLPTAGKAEAPAPDPRPAVSTVVHATMPGSVVVSHAPAFLAISEHNCELAGYCHAEHWRELVRALGVPAVQVQRGLLVVRTADLDAALARLARPLPQRLRAVQPTADQGDDEAAALEGAGLRRKAGGAR
jgi:hypothetical protein